MPLAARVNPVMVDLDGNTAADNIIMAAPPWVVPLGHLRGGIAIMVGPGLGVTPGNTSRARQRACGRRQGCGHCSRTTVPGGRWATEVWWLIPGRSCGSMRRRVRGKYLAQLSNATRRHGVITLTDPLTTARTVVASGFRYRWRP